jgi:hypothetical protein
VARFIFLQTPFPFLLMGNAFFGVLLVKKRLRGDLQIDESTNHRIKITFRELKSGNIRLDYVKIEK